MARTIGQDRFWETLEKVSTRAGNAGEQIIKRDMASFEADRKTYLNNIKKEAGAYKQSVKAIKEVASIRKVLPSGKSALLDIAEGQAKSTVDKVSGYRMMLRELTDKVSEVKENEKDVIEAKKEAADKEFAIVRKLLKNKFIESIRYESGVGLFWTYPPMKYEAEGKIYFLGRPEAGLSESNGSGFSLRLPSYGTARNHIGTYHMRHSDNGDDYCLGGYDEIVKILAAKRQLSSLIRMFYEYFQSCNPKSKHNSPEHSLMDICLPKVADDSYEVWKKLNPKFKFPDPATDDGLRECAGCGNRRELDEESHCDECA